MSYYPCAGTSCEPMFSYRNQNDVPVVRVKNLHVSGTSTLVGDLSMSGTITSSGNLTSGVAVMLESASTAQFKHSSASEAAVTQTAGGVTTLRGLSASPSAADEATSKAYVDSVAGGSSLPLSGGLMSGDISMGFNRVRELAEPTDVSDATTKSYVDVAIGGVVATSGDSMTGALSMGFNQVKQLAEPTDVSDAVTKSYVDTAILGAVPTSGGSMTGDLSMGFNRVRELAEPADVSDAVTKSYVDTNYLALSGGTLSGNVALSGGKITQAGEPTDNSDVATKFYVDNNGGGGGGSYLELSGGLMTGDISMGGNVVTGLAEPVDASDAATKNYITSLLSGQNTGPYYISLHRTSDSAYITESTDMSYSVFSETGDFETLAANGIDFSNGKIYPQYDGTYMISAAVGQSVGGYTGQFEIWRNGTSITTKPWDMRSYSTDQLMSPLSFHAITDLSANDEVDVVMTYALATSSLTQLKIDETHFSMFSVGITSTVYQDLARSVKGDLNMVNNRIINLNTPAASTDSATKGYVDTQIAGVLSSPSYHICYHITSSIAVGSGLEVAFSGTTGTVDASSGIVYDNGTGRFTVDNSGTYAISATLTFYSVDYAALNLRVNGSSVLTHSQVATSEDNLTPLTTPMHTIQTLNAGDYVDLTYDGDETGTIDDGTMIIYSLPSAASLDQGELPLSGGVMFGNIEMSGNTVTQVKEPVDLSDVATKNYVDTQIIAPAAQNRSMGGYRLTNVGQPTDVSDAATKGYVDTPTANRSMGGFKITNTAEPTDVSDVATKNYVDNNVGGQRYYISYFDSTSETVVALAEEVLMVSTGDYTISNGITHNPSTGRFTVDNAGIYVVNAMITADNMTSMDVKLYHNTTAILTYTGIMASEDAIYHFPCAIMQLVDMSANDYIEVSIVPGDSGTVLEVSMVMYNI